MDFESKMENLGHTIASDCALYLNGEDDSIACAERAIASSPSSLEWEASDLGEEVALTVLDSFQLKIGQAPRQTHQARRSQLAHSKLSDRPDMSGAFA